MLYYLFIMYKRTNLKVVIEIILLMYYFLRVIKNLVRQQTC